MIFTDRTITVQKGISSMNDTIILYRGDKGVEIRFTLNEGSPFRFGSGASPNIIEKTEAAYGQLIIKTPNDLPAIFSEVAPTNEGKIVFTITAEMIDEITEVGNYTFQIRLLDESMNSRATIPEVVNGIEIREPIASEDTTNEVGEATVGYALTTAASPEDAFNAEGNYNKTTWVTGDRITAAKLNKIEAGIDGVNQKVTSNGSASNITITDTGNYFTATNVEGALEEAGSQIKEKATKQEVDVERKRIDNFVSLGEGSTTGDAELIDARVGTDGITYNNVGSAIREQINDINTNISDVIERVPLVIGTDNAFMQAYNSTISTEGGNGYSISEPISVKKYEKIIIYAMGYKEAVSILSKCNDDGTYSSLIKSATNQTKFIYEAIEDMNVVVCSNTKNFNWKLYIVKTNYNVTKNVMDALIGFDGTKYNTLYESITSQNNRILSKVQRNTDKLSYNEKCEGITYIDDKYVAPNGAVYTHGQYHPSLCVTENIDTKGYKSILIENLNFVADGNCSLAFYAKDGSVVSVYTYKDTVNDLTLSIPTNCKYVRFTAKISQKNNMSVYLFTDLKEPEFNYCKMLRKIGGIGDSLMSGELVRHNNSTEQLEYKDCYEMSWLSNLCRDTGSECVHYSRGGLTTKTWLENYLGSVKNEENKPSAYYIALGTNDQWRLEGGLGVESDCGTDNETFYGLYSKIINEIKQCNPKAKIFCCSLYFKDQMVEGFNEAIKYMSDLYNCYYVDFVGQYGDLYTGSNSNIYIDGGHFNTFGYIRVGKHILDITNSIIEENLSDFKFIGM